MREDPVARRNRGGGAGLWILLGLAVFGALLVVVVLLRPGPAPAPEPLPEAAAVSMEERVAADQRALRQRDADRDEAKRSQTP